MTRTDKVNGNWYTFKGGNSFKFVFLPLWKWVYPKGKNLLSRGANSFLEQTLSERTWCAGKQTRSHKSCLPCKKNSRKSTNGRTLITLKYMYLVSVSRGQRSSQVDKVNVKKFPTLYSIPFWLKVCYYSSSFLTLVLLNNWCHTHF